MVFSGFVNRLGYIIMGGECVLIDWLDYVSFSGLGYINVGGEYHFYNIYQRLCPNLTPENVLHSLPGGALSLRRGPPRHPHAPRDSPTFHPKSAVSTGCQQYSFAWLWPPAGFVQA